MKGFVCFILWYIFWIILAWFVNRARFLFPLLIICCIIYLLLINVKTMAYTTVTKDLVKKYPHLVTKLGQTIEVSSIAQKEKKVEKKKATGKKK